MNIVIEGVYKCFMFGDGSEVVMWSVIIIMGVDYCKFFVEGVDGFIGVGIYYGVVIMEVGVVRGK